MCINLESLTAFFADWDSPIRTICQSSYFHRCIWSKEAAAANAITAIACFKNSKWIDSTEWKCTTIMAHAHCIANCETNVKVNEHRSCLDENVELPEPRRVLFNAIVLHHARCASTLLVTPAITRPAKGRARKQCLAGLTGQ